MHGMRILRTLYSSPGPSTTFRTDATIPDSPRSGGEGYGFDVSTTHLDPALMAVVERARARAAEADERRAPRPGPLTSPLSPEEQAVVREWLDDGGYAAAAAIDAEDPDLATQ